MKKRWRWVLFFIILAIILFFIEKEIFQYIILIHNLVLDKFLLSITIFSSIIIFLIIGILFLWKENKARWIFPLILSSALSAIICLILKIIIQRQRPFQQGLIDLLPILSKNSYLLWDFSFPSFHSMLIFAALPILVREFKKIKIFWISLAILISLSRIYFGLHFFTDVIIGALIGYLIGIFFIKLELKNKLGKRIIKHSKK